MCTDRVYAGTRGGRQNGSPQFRDFFLESQTNWIELQYSAEKSLKN